ncbi:MAG: hypothetical protein IJZ65_10870, partial [Ruminiclostridium sp.]|nr:hypothetical protein [Ruminiclostridium sp.]
AGVLTSVFVYFFSKKISIITLATILTQIQLILIIVLSSIKQELYTMYPLMLASMAMGGVYLTPKNLFIHWGIMDAVSIAGIFLKDIFYGATETGIIIKGLAGRIIGAFLICYLVNFAIKQLISVQEAEKETERLLEQVRTQVDESNVMADNQRQVVSKIAGISATVNKYSGDMKEIAAAISASSEQQQAEITRITEEIKLVTRENQNSINEAEKASESAGMSKTLLGESQAEMRNMIDAMREIETTSAKIQGIVKAIEDIAFQTNILALNASVEAARAGDMGKGFAVVADEVRNLANKSAEAVQNTTELIDESLVAVNRGKEIADGVANKMNEVITTANKSAEYANNITGLTKQQAVSINTVKSYIDNISQVISHNTDTATESMRVAQAVASDAGKMDEIVSEYR